MGCCDTEDDLDVAFGCLPLAGGVIVLGVVLMVFGGYQLFLATTATYGGFLLILAYIIDALIIICGICCILAASLSNSTLLDFTPNIINICKLAVAIILIVNWGQWLYLMFGKDKWRPGAYNWSNMIVSTAISVVAIVCLCHGKSIAASINLAIEAGKTGWEQPKSKKKPGKDKDLEAGSPMAAAAIPAATSPPTGKVAPKVKAKAPPPPPSQTKTMESAAGKTMDEEADDDEEEEEE
eukprot:Protomagalhaensia_wolfi_Nauph_80__4964@NODE_523_length_2384_cov_10_442644_g389_i0_p2_GENE_NODE_523_length_2384_cov_10_442644_g389_i0NODE_523_length_2384_cov_10_442644_g389_i0_p2_ORF_typecomplete_len238_score74_45WBP1/PF11669_8/5_7e02WBP1/PF11669_8/1_4Far17a_AIG1/PF04750_14/0_52SirB/PF04247_12/2_6SirB/PF04247_12/31Otopetrin/PF03189_13/11_NODE_523_length_2384_cov_10_442644_g389_i07101423